MGHVADGVEEDECTQACPHQCKEYAEGVHVEDESERAIPVERVQIDELAGLGPSHQSGHGCDGRQTGEEGQNPLGPRVQEPCGYDLERGAQEKGAWRNQNEGLCVHG